MGNFTWEIKRELLTSPPENACCKIAACAAFLRTCGSVLFSHGALGFEIVTENDRVAEYFISLLEGLYGVRMELKEAVQDPKSSRDKLTFSYSGERAAEILSDTGIVHLEDGGVRIQRGISPYLTENDCCALSFLKGAFLGSGSCTLPGKAESKTGYHLEFVFSSTFLAEQFCLILERFELIGKHVERGDRCIVYLKSRDAISDFLSLMGANSALKRLVAVSDAREESNYENRTINCLVGNYDRTVRASAEQVLIINKIEERRGLSGLEPSLRAVAIARRDYPTESMSALAERLNMTKSALVRRLKKLTEIYNGLDE